MNIVLKLWEIGDIKGHSVGSLGVKAEDLNVDAWNYIFFNQEYKECPVPKEKLDKMKEQFRYFYPWDLRCSAKDLIRNHLTMSLYNHAVTFDVISFSNTISKGNLGR